MKADCSSVKRGIIREPGRLIPATSYPMPAHWDEIQALAYALIYTALKTLTKPVDTIMKTYVSSAGVETEHETGYTQAAIEYADAYHFVMSPMFTAACELCDVFGDEMLEEVSPHIDFQHVRNGDALLALEAKRDVVIELPKSKITVTMPERWSEE